MTLFKSDNCLAICLSKFSASATYNQACVLASLAITVVLTIIDLSVICLQPTGNNHTSSSVRVFLSRIRTLGLLLPRETRNTSRPIISNKVEGSECCCSFQVYCCFHHKDREDYLSALFDLAFSSGCPQNHCLRSGTGSESARSRLPTTAYAQGPTACDIALTTDRAFRSTLQYSRHSRLLESVPTCPSENGHHLWVLSLTRPEGSECHLIISVNYETQYFLLILSPARITNTHLNS